MRGISAISGKGGRAVSSIIAGAAALCAVCASAQPLSGWNLPPGSEATSSAPAAQGPVDPQNPAVAPGTAPAPVIIAPPPPRASPTPTPVPTPSQRASAPRPAATAPQAEPNRPASRAPVPAEPPAPVIEDTAPAEAAPAPAPAPLPEPAPAIAPAPAASSAWPAWWWALPAALAVLALGWLLARRRARPADDEAEPAQVRPEPPAAPVPGLAPAPAPPPVVDPLPGLTRASGSLDFTPALLRISLVYATLRFRLELTAGTAFPAGRVLAGMISAHGSLPRDQQLAPPPEALAVLAATPALVQGQTIAIEGELQLPLASIRPLRQGEATFLVPLVRLAWLGENEPGVPHLELGCAFTVGLAGGGPALAPLRLDTGPREVTGLSAREIEAARRTALLPLDPARAAG